MAGLVQARPGHPRLTGPAPKKDVDASDKRGHDGRETDSILRKIAVGRAARPHRRADFDLSPGHSEASLDPQHRTLDRRELDQLSISSPDTIRPAV